MLRLKRNRFGLDTPVSRWGVARSNAKAKLRAASKRLGSMLVTGAVMAASIVLIVFSLGIRLPFFQASSTAATVDVKPRVVKNNQIIQSCNSNQSQSNPYFSLCPSFSQDFRNELQGSVSTNEFNIATGPLISNHEAEFYTNGSDNVRIENGSLILEARQQAKEGYKYTSGRIDTHGKEDFLYGKLVVRAQVPDGIGNWPAIWMLPSQPKYAKLSPTSDWERYLNDGEIDVAESVGLEPHTVYGVAHSLAYPENGPDRSYYNTVNVPSNDTSFHNYELDWTPTSLTFSVDGTPFYTYAKKADADWRSWPYDQPFYLVINLALGGTWAGKDKAQFPGDGIDKSALPAELKIQSINYYSYIGQQ